MADWDHRFMELARRVATWSKDKSRQVVASLLGPIMLSVQLASMAFREVSTMTMRPAISVRPSICGLNMPNVMQFTLRLGMA